MARQDLDDHAAAVACLHIPDAVADGNRVHVLDLAYLLHGMAQRSRIGGGEDQLFMDQGRERAVELPSLVVDSVMSQSFSKDDADVVFFVCIHCQGFLYVCLRHGWYK